MVIGYLDVYRAIVFPIKANPVLHVDRYAPLAFALAFGQLMQTVTAWGAEVGGPGRCTYTVEQTAGLFVQLTW